MKPQTKKEEARGWQDGSVNTGRNIGIIICRVEPPHLGHEMLAIESLKHCDRVIIVLGSAGKAADIKNPWSDMERVAMLEGVMRANNINDAQIRYESVHDHHTDEMWLVEVRTKLKKHIEPNDNVILFGHDKDHTTFYLKLFPDWRLRECGSYDETLNATRIRNLIFEDKLSEVEALVPPSVYKYLEGWVQSFDFTRLKAEYNHIKLLNKQYEGLKNEVTFTTVDALVTYRGKVLVITRKAKGGVGDGLLSLPGGFFNKGERLVDAAIRISKKKTQLTLKKEWIYKTQIFDDPRRSNRGRIITHVYRFNIPPDYEVQQSLSGEWLDYAEVSLQSQNFFEDHAMIINEMI